MTAPGMARLLAWFAADAEAEGQGNPLAPEGPWCPRCGTRLRDGGTVRACPVCDGGRG